ncbi:hypothetical protein Gotur_018069 [Gossypium turneri]
MIAGFQELNAFSLLPFVAETLHFFSPEVLAGVFPVHDEPFLGFPPSVFESPTTPILLTPILIPSFTAYNPAYASAVNGLAIPE